MEPSNDWDLQAVVRSCGAAASSSSSSSGAAEPRSAVAPPRHKEAAGPIVDAGSESFLGRPAATMRGLEYLNLDHVLPFSITPTSGERAHGNEVLISFPAASTSGQSKKQAGRNAPRPKKSKKSQLKKVVCEVPVADGGVSTDLWAWRKYGQKPIKGSPYPRGYYKCSSMRACMARKLVERNPEKPEVLIVTYIGEHCHAVPTMLNSLAGTTRHKPPSPDQHSLQMSDEACPMIVDGGAAETPDDESNLWPVDMSLLDEYPLDDFLAGPFDDDVGVSLEDQDEQDGLGRRMSL